jgi:hypothetical membrane protein
MIKQKYTRYNPGALLWFLSIQYYVVQIILAAGFKTDYSWAYNTISDLGNTHCGAYGTRLVCSPHHSVMNASFIVLGLTMISGAVLLQRRYTGKLLSTLGFGSMALSGVGSILVGLFPENTISGFHITGAGLSFFLGNVALLLLGFSLPNLPRLLKLYTIFSGLIGLITLVLFLKQSYLGLGIGGMERITAYPQSIWLVIIGAYLLLKRSDTPARQK